jgi:IS605 OrfB family transposase
MSEYILNDRLQKALIDKEMQFNSGTKISDARNKAATIIKETFDCSLQNIGYRLLNEKAPELSSYIRSALSNNVYSNFKEDRKKVEKGERTYRAYKKGIPIPFVKDAFRNMNEKGFILLNYDIEFVFGRDRSRNIDLINNIISGYIKMSDSSFSYVGKKIMLNLSFTPEISTKELDKEKIANVDISYKVPVIVSLGDKNVSVGNPENMINLRRQIEKRMSNVQHHLKFNKGGKGRKQKLKALDMFTSKEKDIASTENHKLTKHIINEVIRMGAGKINIVHNISDDIEKYTKENIIRYMGYHDIISKLKYKAELNGIEVL